MDEPLVPEQKLAEARTLWEIALIYIALGAAARTLTSSGSPQQVAASGYVAAQILARAYWRLMRAIWTGYTIQGRGSGSGEMVSLLDLYQDFESLAFRAIPVSKHPDTRDRMAAAAAGAEDALGGLVPESEGDPLDRFPTEGVVGEPETDKDFVARGPRETDWPSAKDIIVEAMEAYEESLTEDERNAADALRELDKRLAEAREAERKREQKAVAKTREGSSRRGRESSAARRRSMARAERAAAAMKTAQSGARDVVNNLATRDPRAIGWVRVPHHPTPCGWCLMLASRGIILYKSAATARSAWHENCHCTAEPVFSWEHYKSSQQFAKNRALHMLWQDHGFGKGERGEKDFRNYFLRQYARGVNLHTVIRENAEKHR